MKLKSYYTLDRKSTLISASLLSAFIIFIDLITPPQILLSIYFILPIIIVSWYTGLGWALVFSAALPLARFLTSTLIEPIWDVNYSVINFVNRFIVLSMVSFIVTKLSDSIKQIKILEGLIPICSNCKKIRDDDKKWQTLEIYIAERSNAEFTHSICPECTARLYGNHMKKQPFPSASR